MTHYDPEAYQWEDIATYGFWMRYPKALDADRPARPPGLEGEAGQFARFGVELHVLEADLTGCLREFALAFEALYAPPDLIHHKKFAIVYHIDNFNVRIHKLRENVYRMLALVVGLDHSGTPRRGESPRAEQVRRALPRLGLGGVGELLLAFERDSGVRAVLDDRHRFVHQCRDERDEKLGPVERLRARSSDEDEIARGLRWLLEHQHIDAYADRRHSELCKVLESAQRLRHGLCWELHGKLVENIRRTPRARWRPAQQALVDMWEALA